jgi:predicted Zn-dependent peptidase/outer membrane lipoprotein-sorting protein
MTMFMRNWKAIGWIAAAALVFTAPAAAADIDKLDFPPLGGITLPEVERTVLPNGMVVMFVEDHELPLVSFNVMVRAGEVYETDGKIALVDVFGEVQRTGGTAKMTGDEIDELLESIGAAVETSLGTTYGSVSAGCLADQIDTVLPIFADVLMHPEFRQNKIDLVKTQIRSSIARRNDEPMGVMNREFTKLLYGADSPYAPQTEYVDVDSLTREDLLAFHARYYHPNGVILGVWGDFDTAAMKAKIDAAFGSWPRSEIDYPPAPEVVQATPGSIHYIEKTDVEQAFIRIGHMGVRYDNPDMPKIRVMSDILGGGSTSRMYKTVRTEKGLAYSSYAVLIPGYSRPGSLFSFSTTKLASTHETLTTMLDVINEFREGQVTDDELKNAKEAYLNSYAFYFESTDEVLDRLMLYEYYGYPADFLQKFRAGVEAVTAADVAAVARKYIKPDDLIMLVVGDASRFDQQLTDLGQVAEIDIAIPEPKATETIAAATPEALARGREIADETVARLGGPGPVREVKNNSYDFSLTMIAPQGEFQMTGTQTVVFPDQVRTELQAPFGTLIQVLDGEAGWTQDPQRGLQVMAGTDADEMRKAIRFSWLALLQALVSGEVEIQSLGAMNFEDLDAEDILLRFSDGSTAHLYLDAGDLTPLGIRRMGNTPQGPAEIIQLLADFRDVGAVRMPFTVTSKANNQVFQTMQISDARVNTEVEDELFTRPEN